MELQRLCRSWYLCIAWHGAISGLVYLIGILGIPSFPLLTPGAAALLPQFLQDTDVTLCHTAGVESVNRFVENRDVLPFEIRVAWLGLSAIIPQVVRINAVKIRQGSLRRAANRFLSYMLWD